MTTGGNTLDTAGGEENQSGIDKESCERDTWGGLPVSGPGQQDSNQDGDRQVPVEGGLRLALWQAHT